MALPKIETRPISSLKLWDKNPRSIKTDRFNELKKSITELGFNDVLKITEDGTVIGGNMRLRALEELGWQDVPVVVTNAKTDSEILRIALRDNEEFGYYEEEQVAELALAYLEPLELETFELHLGKPTKLNLLTDKFGPEVEEDEPPEVDETNVVSKLGEIYQLGKHRVMCGDSTDFGTVSDLMDGIDADMIFTDPPYNVNYKGSNGLSIENDNADDATFYQFLFDSFSNYLQVAKAGAAIYVCHADLEGLNFRKAFKESGYQLRSTIIWNKNALVMGRADYHWKHEPILYGWKEGAKHSWYGDRSQSTVWDISKPSVNDNHPTMKPIELVARAINNSSKQGDTVLDLFLGSGSTLIACEQTGRICYGMELDPKYCDVIRKRYTKLIDPDNWEDTWQQKTPLVDLA